MNDFRFAARQLFKTPAFTLPAIATLALAIGANTVVQSLIRATRADPTIALGHNG